jgi:RNA polymerase sigma factor (sigma-70 family)
VNTQQAVERTGGIAREPHINSVTSDPSASAFAGSTPVSTAWEQGVMTRLVARDDSALGEVYDQYGSFVFGLASRVIGDRTAAEDVVQEVFLGLWNRPDAFDPERGRLRTLLGTMAHRRAVDYVRREEARRRRTERDAALEVTISPDVDEMAMALLAAERVREAVDRLPDDQREAIMLAYFGGRTYRQVAEELGIPEGTAKSRMRLGLGRIAEALEKNGIESWTL